MQIIDRCRYDMKKSICIIVIISLIFTSCTSTSKEEDILKMNSKEIVEYYISAINEGKENSIYSVKSDEYKMLSSYYGYYKKINIISLKINNSPEPSDRIKDLYKLDVYSVELDIIYKDKKEPENATWEIYVGKKSENDPWQIYDIR